MLECLRQRLTYANVMATIAVFIALGGSSYAAVRISGRDIRNHSIGGSKLKRDSLTGRHVREARLGQVPRARNAELLEGMTAASFRVRCPLDTFPTADVCIERTARPAAAYGTAVLECAEVGTPAGPGRRLPTHNELMSAMSAVDLTVGGELTANILPSASPGRVNAIYMTDEVGGIGVTSDTAVGGKAFRCAANPLN